jgi:hypothetical protein
MGDEATSRRLLDAWGRTPERELAAYDPIDTAFGSRVLEHARAARWW